MPLLPAEDIYLKTKEGCRKNLQPSLKHTRISVREVKGGAAFRNL